MEEIVELTDEEYFAEMQEWADRVGDEGLHIVPEEVLAAVESDQEGTS